MDARELRRVQIFLRVLTRAVVAVCLVNMCTIDNRGVKRFVCTCTCIACMIGQDVQNREVRLTVCVCTAMIHQSLRKNETNSKLTMMQTARILCQKNTLWA